MSPLKMARVERRWTLEYLAARVSALGVSSDTGNLSRLERGEQKASLELAEKLVQVFEGDLDEIQVLYPERFVSKPETEETKMIDDKYHVSKGSRSFTGFSYRGPALKHTNFAGRADTSFDTLEQAVQCAQELTDVNPVGFEVYHWGRKVWPVTKEETEMELKAAQFAEWVAAAAKAHEDSFDKAASNEAQAACDARYAQQKAEGDPHYYLNVVDHKQFYKMDLREATASVVPAEFVEPVYLLLQLAWNDINDWATQHAQV